MAITHSEGKPHILPSQGMCSTHLSTSGMLQMTLNLTEESYLGGITVDSGSHSIHCLFKCLS